VLALSVFEDLRVRGTHIRIREVAKSKTSFQVKVVVIIVGHLGES
jgi:hypothetical protein